MSAPADSELRYTEYWYGRTGLSIAVTGVLMSERSEYQHVQVLESDALGRILTLDGVLMFTAHDEFVYHEMIVHPSLSLLGDPGNVLIVGGGDGGAAREALRYQSVPRVDLVEIDGLVVDAAKRYFPEVSSGFTDKRLHLHLTDGADYLAATRTTYDLIIVDSTDPVGLAEGLFTQEFYEDCFRALSDRGMLVVQSESPFDPNYREVPRQVKRLFLRLFPIAETYLAFVPSYAFGMWSFTLGSKRLHPVRDFEPEQAAARSQAFAGQLKYYHADLHRAAFALPAFVSRAVSEA